MTDFRVHPTMAEEAGREMAHTPVCMELSGNGREAIIAAMRLGGRSSAAVRR